MKLKQTIQTVVAVCMLFVGVAAFVPATPVMAEPIPGPLETPSETTPPADEASPDEELTPSTGGECGGVPTSILICEQTGDDSDIKNTGIWGILLIAINILTAGVGIAAVGGIVYASILYSSSAGEAEKIKKAMTIISDIVIGVVAYALMYAALNFLVPGGLFNAVTP